MKKHPHRYFFIGMHTNIRTMSAAECEISKFTLKPPETYVFVMFLISFTCALLLMLFSMLGFAIAGYQNFDNANWNIPMMVFYGVQFMMFLLLPVPMDGISMVINEVQRAEEKDDLEVTPRFWIYFHYFILRNHPFLTRYTFIIRQVVLAAGFYVCSMFTHTPLTFFTFLSVFSVFLVCSLSTLIFSTKKGYWD